MNKLLPCPFCGNEPQEITTNGKPLVVCWCRGCVNDPKNWNTRPIEDALQARIAELEKDVEYWRNRHGKLLEFIAGYDGAMLEAGKEWERQRYEFGATEAELAARIAELEHDLTNKEIEYTDLWDDALAFQARIAKLDEKLAELVEAGNKMRDLIEQDYDGYLDETIEWRGVAEEADDVLREREE